MSKALLIMDVQTGIVDRVKDAAVLLNNIHVCAKSARSANVPVIYVVIKFREGFPEVNPDRLKSNPVLYNALLSTKIHDYITPQPQDITIKKLRVSAFAGSDLEIILRSKQIKHLTLCGIATGGVVLSTLREAADKDYQLTVIEDCCADFDEEVHRVLTTKVFPRQADVVTHQQWIDGIAGANETKQSQ